MGGTVWTIGHSTREVEEIARLAKEHGIEAIVDVRRYPQSKRHPQASKASLERALPVFGLGYIWLGRELGGFVEGAYEDYMKTDAFLSGLERLEDLASKRPLAFMCAEREPDKCHRRFIARALAQRGWRVVHVIRSNEVQVEPAPLPE